MGSNRICSVESLNPQLSTLSYYHSDHISSPNVITDINGSQVQLLEYRPYGELNVNSGTDITDYKFTGKELDESTGLYNNLARLYNPQLGRFTTADPIDYSDEGIRLAGGKDLVTFLTNPQNLNRYTYCLNNPLRYTDLDGLYTLLVPGIKMPANREEGWYKQTKVYKDLVKKGETVKGFNWPGSLFSEEIYKNLAQEIIQARQEATKKGEKFNIVAHSWGGTATIEVLKTLKIKVDNLITVGSPIPGFGFKPKGTENWTNLVSPLDPIAWGSLGTDAKQHLTISIHIGDFNNPFVSKTIGKIIIKRDKR